MLTLFYPNECFVCKSRSTLSRCSRCRLINYCGENHQKSDWTDHKDFCAAICRLLKIKKLSHIFQELRGCSPQKWTNARINMVQRVSSLLGRDLQKHELEMIQFPRCCFVCYDTNQNNLTNCPQCPLVSFCKEHPDTSHHDKTCSKIKMSHDLEVKLFQDLLPFSLAVFTIMSRISNEILKLPNSMSEFLDEYLKTTISSDQDVRFFVSTYFCIPFTIASAIQKSNCSSSAQLTIHISGLVDLKIASKFEILFHILPNLKELKIVFTESNGTINIPLCSQCFFKKKKVTATPLRISYPNYILKNEYETPDLIAFIDLVPVGKEDERYPLWTKLLNTWTKLNCPLIFMSDTVKSAKLLKECLNTSFWKPLICYEGLNNFASLMIFRDCEEWDIARICQYLIMTKAPNSSSANKESIKHPESSIKTGQENAEEFRKSFYEDIFYSSVCHVCKIAKASVTCKRCKMIFYCGSEHLKKDWPSHKEICKVIVGFLREQGTPHLFDNFKNVCEESWLAARSSFVERTKLQLQRELCDYEVQMFLYPRTCFVCNESNLEKLKVCECGISLCMMHKDDSNHKNLCKDYALELKLRLCKMPKVITSIGIPVSKEEINLPPSIHHFIDSYLELKSDSPEQIIKDINKIVISDFFSRPLTFIYALKKLKCSIPNSMVIHIIGASGQEVELAEYWKFVLECLQNLKSIQIIFIGFDLPQKQFSLKNPLDFNVFFSPRWKDFNYKSFEGSYDQYFEKGDFLKPDIIFSFNLDIGNCMLKSSEYSLSKTFSIIRQLKVPFVITTTTEGIARKTVSMLSTSLGKMKSVEIFEKNPYCGLFPDRDFISKGMCYSNKFIVIFANHSKAADAEKINAPTESQTKSLNDKQGSSTEKNEFGMKKNFLNSKFKSKVEKSDSGENNATNNKVDDKQSVRNTQNKDLHVERSNENSDCEAEYYLNNEKLMKENLLLQEENKILKENLQLREKNMRLRKENLVLNKELEMLKKNAPLKGTQ